MTAFKDMEFETKFIIFAVIAFAIFAIVIYNIYEDSIDSMILKATNRDLTEFLQNYAAKNPNDLREKEILTRQMQWEVSAPFIARTQKSGVRIILVFFTALLLIIAAAFLIYMTAPLKKLTKSVEKIGKGEKVVIDIRSGGSLGRLERQVSQMQDELFALREHEKIAAMENTWQDIARVMAHEIKNPLTPMRLLVDKMEEENAAADERDPKISRFVERMNRQLNSLEILVNKFRSFSKSQEAIMAPHNIYDTLCDNADDFPEIFTVIVGGKEINAMLDKNFFSQILLNLYKNSINAGAKHIGIKIIEENTSIRIEIKDDGRGIEKEKLDKVFLPYTTYTDGGSGIGLSVVRNLCEKMGAVCFADSAPKMGFTMTIILKKG